MILNLQKSVSPYQAQMFPLFRFTISEKAKKILCLLLEKKYDSLPWRIKVELYEPPEDTFIPESLKERLKKHGFDWPDLHDEELEDDQQIPRTEVELLNLEKMDILNQAAALGCSWALKEVARLFITEAR